MITAPRRSFGLALALAAALAHPACEPTGDGPAVDAAPLPPPSCAGAFDGPTSGPFTCLAVANFYPEGSPFVGERKSSLVTILNDEHNPQHTRPTGVRSFSTNIELSGEVKPGTYTLADANLPGTVATVRYRNDTFFTQIKELRLTLTQVTYQSEADVRGVGKARVFLVKGQIELLLGQLRGPAETRVGATF